MLYDFCCLSTYTTVACKVSMVVSGGGTERTSSALADTSTGKRVGGVGGGGIRVVMRSGLARSGRSWWKVVRNTGNYAADVELIWHNTHSFVEINVQALSDYSLSATLLIKSCIHHSFGRLASACKLSSKKLAIRSFLLLGPLGCRLLHACQFLQNR